MSSPPLAEPHRLPTALIPILNMCSRVAILITLAAVVAAQSGECQDADDDCDVDRINLLQTPLQPDDVTKSKGLLEEQSASSGGADFSFKASAAFAEYVAMTLLVVIGCGSAMATCKENGWVLQVALSFGLAISALAYAIGHYSGGQINCAVTFGLVLGGHVTVAQGLMNFLAQMLGSITGALILTGIFPEEMDKTGGLGCNKVSEGWTQTNAFLGEFVMTFLLMFVVLETAINPATAANRELAALAIGFAVFLAHSVLINIDGCSINPTRSAGPAMVRKLFYKKDAGSFHDMWVFWAGPLLGAAAATGVSAFLMRQ
jgi:MIP family channel proteins